MNWYSIIENIKNKINVKVKTPDDTSATEYKVFDLPYINNLIQRLEEHADKFSTYKVISGKPFTSKKELLAAIKTYKRTVKRLDNKNDNITLDVKGWDVSKLTDFSHVFENFNGTVIGLNTWKFKKRADYTKPAEIDMSYMFYNSTINTDISSWDVSNVKNMAFMFANSSFNREINAWDVSGVTDMSFMFANNKQFNRRLSDWNVVNVKSMKAMFYNSNFNKYISRWKMCNVKDASFMFANSKFRNGVMSNTIEQDYVSKTYTIDLSCDINNWFNVTNYANTQLSFKQLGVNRTITKKEAVVLYDYGENGKDNSTKNDSFITNITSNDNTIDISHTFNTYVLTHNTTGRNKVIADQTITMRNAIPTTINTISGFKSLTNCTGMFYNCRNIQIDANEFIDFFLIRNNITTTGKLIYNTLPELNKSELVNFNGAFYNCKYVKLNTTDYKFDRYIQYTKSRPGNVDNKAVTIHEYHVKNLSPVVKDKINELLLTNDNIDLQKIEKELQINNLTILKG